MLAMSSSDGLRQRILSANDIIFYTLDLIDEIFGTLTGVEQYSKQLSIDYEDKLKFIESFYKILKKKASEQHIEVDESKYISDIQYERLVHYLKFLQIPRISVDLSQCDKIDAVLGFCKILQTIKIVQFGNLMILKYRQSIAVTGFHKLAIVCRGKVINTKTREIVQYPYDKFYNLNENEEYSYERISNLMSQAEDIEVTEKFDGSLISVTRLSDSIGNFGKQSNILVTSMGSFDGDQVQIAKKLLKNRYSKFLKYLEENNDNRTYVFEVIQPEDKHVVDYGNSEELILTGVRDLYTYQLLSYSNMLDIQNNFELSITPRLKDINIQDYLDETRKTGQNKEGWVFRLRFKDGYTFMFKLKYNEYFSLSRQKADIPMQKVYGMLKSGHFEEWYDTLSDYEKDSVTELQEDINVKVGQIESYVKQIALGVIHSYNEDENTFKFKELQVDKIKSILNDESGLGRYIISCLKGFNSFKIKYKSMGFEDFMQFIDYIDDKQEG